MNQPVNEPNKEAPKKPFVKTFTLRGRSKYCYVPDETRHPDGTTTFVTTDGRRYVRDLKTGSIRRVKESR